MVALNDSLHFLTATQYQQISAAQAVGDSQLAAALAIQAYSDAVMQRTGAVQDNLGSLEKAWNWVRNAAVGAWDAMLGVGRSPDTAMKRQDMFAQWQAAEKEYQVLSRNLKVDPDYSGSNPLQKADAERLRNARQSLALKKRLMMRRIKRMRRRDWLQQWKSSVRINRRRRYAASRNLTN